MNLQHSLLQVYALADMLLQGSSETAFNRLVAEAREQKQSVEEIAYRRASNLLRSMSLRQST